MNISSRLKKCSEMVDENCKIVDVGTDHAYLPIYLAMQNKIISAIACDVRVGPLENAVSNIKKYNLEKKISTCLSNGLQKINENNADEIIIAGMGGNLIIDILENCAWKNKINKKYILQPMNKERDLRIYLASKGYETEKEEAVICMGKVYTVIKTVYTSKSYDISPIQEYIGFLNKNPEESKTYIEKQLRDIENRKKGAIIKGLTQEAEKYQKLIKEIENLYI